MFLCNKTHQWPRSLFAEFHLDISVTKRLCVLQVRQEPFHCLRIYIELLVVWRQVSLGERWKMSYRSLTFVSPSTVKLCTTTYVADL